MKTAVITDKLPEGVKFVSADQEGVYSEEDHTVTWNVITDAHTEGTVTVKVKVLASAAGTELNNQARVGMDEADITTVTDNGGDDDDTTTNFVAAKTVVNAEGTEIDKQVVKVDDLVTYHIPYQNHSKNTRTITITDGLPQDVTYVEASEGGNVQSIVHGQTVIWVLEAAPKTDGEVWVTVKVTKALKGQAFANSAMLEVKDQETGQTKKAVTNQVINYVLDDVVKEVLSENGRKNLEGEKVKGGRTLLYRVTFKNPAATERTFTVTDELPEGVTFVSAENEGTYDEAAKTITWTVNLASGKSQTVSFLVTVDKTADCDFIQNVAKVHVDETDADSNPVKVYVKGDKSTDPENQEPKDDPNPDDQKPDDGKPADDPKTDDGTPSDDPKTEDTTPKDDDKTPTDDTKKQDDQKPVIKPTETDDKKDTTTPTQDSSKSDDNSIIYGHHMQIGTMFAGISWYEDQSYYDEHPVMYLMTPSAMYRIELFSGYITTMDSSAYMQTFGSIREHTDWLKEVSGRSDFRANLEISAYDRVITLSTCAYRFENARYVLHGKLVELR